MLGQKKDCVFDIWNCPLFLLQLTKFKRLSLFNRIHFFILLGLPIHLHLSEEEVTSLVRYGRRSITSVACQALLQKHGLWFLESGGGLSSETPGVSRCVDVGLPVALRTAGPQDAREPEVFSSVFFVVSLFIVILLGSNPLNTPVFIQLNVMFLSAHFNEAKLLFRGNKQ